MAFRESQEGSSRLIWISEASRQVLIWLSRFTFKSGLLGVFRLGGIAHILVASLRYLK